MRSRLRSVGALIALFTVLSGCTENRPASAPPPSGSVWVADEGRDSLTVIDAATGDVAMTLTGITAPHNVQVGRDGSVVYAVSSAGIVVATDPTTYAVTAVAPTGPDPAHVIEAPNGKVYVTNSGDGTVSVYQAPGLTPVGRSTVNGMPGNVDKTRRRPGFMALACCDIGGAAGNRTRSENRPEQGKQW